MRTPSWGSVRRLGAALGVMALGLISTVGTPVAAAESTSALEAKNHRRPKFQLPAEGYRAVTKSMTLDAVGRTVETALDGTALRIDTDGDGTLDVKVDGDAAFVRLEGKTKDGKPTFYSLRLVNQGGWKYTWGSSRVGKIAGTKVYLVDQNLNGRFNDVGEDAIVVGRSKYAAFLSQVVAVDGKLYTLNVDADGRSLRYAPFTGKTGVFQPKCDTQAKVLSALVRSKDGSLCFDLSGREPVTIPAGEYLITSGHIGLGENRMQFRSGRARTLEINEGETTTFGWGGPVRAEFDYQRQGDQLVLSPEQVRYYGKAGEEYHSFFPRGESPKFTVRNLKTGREIAEAYFPGTC